MKPSDIKEKYRTPPQHEEYRVGFVKELVDVKNNLLEVDGSKGDEMMMNLRTFSSICVSPNACWVTSFSISFQTVFSEVFSSV